MEHELFMFLVGALGEKGLLVLLAAMLGLSLVYVAARVYVAMTPSHDDDEMLERGTSAFRSALSSIAGLVLGGKRQPPAPPTGGAAAAALVLCVLLGVGCVPVSAVHEDAVELQAGVAELQAAVKTWRAGSQPGEGISDRAWGALGASVDRSVDSLGRNADELEAVTRE